MKRTILALILVAPALAHAETGAEKGAKCDRMGEAAVALAARGETAKLPPAFRIVADYLNEGVAGGKVKPEIAGTYFRGFVVGYCMAVVFPQEDAAPAPRKPSVRMM